MLDPEFKEKASGKSFSARTTLKNLLTEYLLECCNMDSIPERLLETVRFIIDISEKKSASCTGKTSGRATGTLAWSHPKGALSTPMPTCRTFSAEEIQEEVHLLLNLSAQAKQIVWDFLPENIFDKDFADAYIDDDYVEDCCYDEAGGGSEVQDFISGHIRYYSNNNTDDINCQSESVGETIPVDDSKSPVSSSPAEMLSPLLFSPNKNISLQQDCGNGDEAHSHNSRLLSAHGLSKISSCDGRSEKYDDDGLEESKAHLGFMRKFHASPNFFLAEATGIVSKNDEKNGLVENAYLIIQEACDETSMFAYSFVGHVLNGLDKLEPTPHANASDPTRTVCEDGVGSVVMNALELLVPSFPSRGKEELRVFMGL
ncbi:unnamed protein product [Cuscuta epithymum]|uniref:Uncharacterized protein n=1 Tax=Cuscuta epithymum TaxID=186058 RepID=A0AAV0DXD8_9ASTE|nr:unnamed protein product [Cuscuta epithymum]